MKLKFLPFLFLGVMAAACVDIPDFDNVPAIQYNGISQFETVDESSGNRRENVVVTVDFTDGDGDLGASAQERSDSIWKIPYQGWGNYELITGRRGADGKWTEQILSEDKEKWMPILKPDGKPGPIKGKIDLNTSFLYSNSSVMTWVRFRVRIRDRALHVSNQILTDSIQVPIPRN